MRRVLAEIVASKRRELAALGPAPERRARGERVLALRRDGALRLVTEIKRRSPSAGPLSTALDVDARALAYARGGAAMISVLCDGPFFDGSFQDLARARATLDAAGLDVPLLAKEFVLEERQLAHAAGHGADAVLLLARIVTPAELGTLVSGARRLGLEPLVEVVTEAELEAALAADAKVIGVNARDLDTLVMDLPRAARILAAIPETCIALHLSGLRTPADVAAVASSRADAALIGEALMREDDPVPLLAAFVAAGKSPS